MQKQPDIQNKSVTLSSLNKAMMACNHLKQNIISIYLQKNTHHIIYI